MTTVTENNVSEEASADQTEEESKNDPDANGIHDDDDYIAMDDFDVWEEEDQPRRRSWDRARGGKERRSRDRDLTSTRDRDKDRDRDRERDRDRGRRRSRSNDRRRSRSNGRRRSRSNGRRRSRSNERRKEQSRRDPDKSSKDIELDKLKAKKDNDSKILAEKEKAIKTLLDSDDVVPPGTEGEAIQSIVDTNAKQQEKQQQENEEPRKSLSSRDNRRRSPVHSRLGPKRSPRSPERRRRRSPTPEGRCSNSAERRLASRRRLRERMRRSRSRERRRSRSLERRRSPDRRRTPDRRRSRSTERRRRSRSPEHRRRTSRSPYERRRRSTSRSPNRNRKRSPFINEIARQFPNEAPVMPPDSVGSIPISQPPMGPPIHGMDMVGPAAQPLFPGAPGMVGASSMGPPMMGPGPQGIISGPTIIAAPAPPFIGYDACPPAPNFGTAPDFVGPPGPVMYQAPPMMRPVSPQPVPSPVGPPINSSHYPIPMALQQHPNAMPGMQPNINTQYLPNDAYSIRRSKSPSFEGPYKSSRSKREERMKTPEPPIISDLKFNEKTSLSSLLEASVSTKDSSGQVPSWKGYRPEITRQCEKALRSLPTEDPRLKMKGRFFFDPQKKSEVKVEEKKESNSILLRKGRTEIHWEEEEKLLYSQMPLFERKRIVCHQKICQTDDPGHETVAVQATNTYTDFCVQVNTQELQPQNREDTQRRPPSDRLDWSMRETFDHAAKLRDSEDLRWTINNNATRERSSAPQPWNRQPIVNDHHHGTIVAPIEQGGQLDRIEIGRKDSERLDLELRSLSRIDADRGIERFEMERRPVEREVERRGVDRMDVDYRLLDRPDLNPADRPFMNRMSVDSRFMDRLPLETRNHDLDMREIEMRERERMEMLRERELIEARERSMLQLREDYEMRNNVEDIRNNFNKTGFGAIRNLDILKGDREIPRGSPAVMEEEQDELEIIEERGFDREPWKHSSPNLASFNNARGGAAIRGFRGRVGGFRTNF